MAYSKEFREKIVNEYLNGKTITELSDKYKIVPSTVFFWVKYYKSNKKTSMYPQSGVWSARQLTDSVRALRKEIEQLKKEVKELKLKRNK